MVTTRCASLAATSPPPAAAAARNNTSGGGSGGGGVPHVPLLGVQPGAEAFDAALDRRSDYYRLQALSHVVDGHAPAARRDTSPLLNVPNVLTLLRLLAVPAVVAAWPSGAPGAALWCAGLFVAASLTDWLDGYIARRFEIVTVFGAFLDPVADKIMVTAVLILLILSPPAPLAPADVALPVIAVICREVTMSALREWAAAAGGGAHAAVKVSSLGKWKTALQMVAMSVLLFARDQTVIPSVWKAARLPADGVTRAAFTLLWGAALLGLWSLAAYFANVWTHFVAPPPPPPAPAARRKAAA